MVFEGVWGGLVVVERTLDGSLVEVDDGSDKVILRGLCMWAGVFGEGTDVLLR